MPAVTKSTSMRAAVSPRKTVKCPQVHECKSSGAQVSTQKGAYCARWVFFAPEAELCWIPLRIPAQHNPCVYSTNAHTL
eukprot:4266253-Pyramimonas_sp.AAC.1